MWGKVFYTNSIRDALTACSYGIKVIAIDDENTIEHKSSGIIVLSVLLPPFEAINQELNGNKRDSYNIYMNYLINTDICREAFGVILTALFYGKTILFYIAPDQAKNLDYGNILFNYLYNEFGITFGSLMDQNSGEMINTPDKICNRLNMMYATNSIPYEIYCNNYPMQFCPSREVALKIITSFGFDPNTISDFENTARRLMDQSIEIYKSSREKKLEPVVMVVRKD